LKLYFTLFDISRQEEWINELGFQENDGIEEIPQKVEIENIPQLCASHCKRQLINL
jgi:hypothetical protein